MPLVPSRPKIYHISHLSNLANIVASGKLVSDARRIASRLNCLLVGMSTFKKRRLEEIEVTCHPGRTVGQFVPYYFCPRSIMLYILHMGNHPELNYEGGQQPIIHLQCYLNTVIRWAKTNGVPWAFSDRNAGSYLANFYNTPTDLDKIDWSSVKARDFRDSQVKEGKQAEFLVLDSFPWKLIEKIGTINTTISRQVKTAITGNGHQPVIAEEPSWYF